MKDLLGEEPKKININDLLGVNIQYKDLQEAVKAKKAVPKRLKIVDIPKEDEWDEVIVKFPPPPPPFGDVAYTSGFDPYEKPKVTKEEEEESNLIRIDLEKAAKLCARALYSEGFEIDENSDDFLKMYDKYYDILFKSKA